MVQPITHPLCMLLQTIAERPPTAIALVCGDRQLTYHDLDQHSNQLAHYLHHAHLEPNALVGIYLDRSIEMVVAMLGILKAGLTYVPLDPHYPSDRIHFIAQETQLSIVLTHTDLRDRFPHLPATQLICLDTDWNAIAQESREPLTLELNADYLAYVMYTSGSTGKPKGVKMPRANIVRYITALHQLVPVQTQDIYLHVASFSFSSSVRQLFLPLMAGATVVIATRDQTKNPIHLLHLMRQQRVTIFDGVPSIWRYALQIINESAELRLEASELNLRFLILSGELTPCILLHNLRQFFGDRVQFANVYGQTETIGNTAYLVPSSFDQHQGYVPVGYPYPHNQAYILDEHLHPVSDGEVGELHMAGGCLAHGYMNREDLTAEKFIDQPWAHGPSRLFKTGDLARCSPDGCIELLGRTDFQVKIRGMRVELDEIAATLEQHPTVKAAAIAAHDSPTGDKVVVGYLVPQPSHQSTSRWHQDLRTFVGEHLPDYMVPALFVDLDALPQTPSGKLDRRGLIKPSSLEAQPSADVQADTPIQAIFCKAFHLQRLDLEDTFISLGGHSLLYVQFSIELERHLGYVPSDWESMTIAELDQQPQKRSAFPIIETNILLRALAICGVVANHARLVPLPYVQGGALLLLFIAGLNFARFQSHNLFQGNQKQILTSLLSSLIIPYLILETFFQVYTQDFSIGSLLMVSNFMGPEVMTMFLQVWFIQVFVQCVVILVLLFSIRKLRETADASPWGFSLSLVGITGVMAWVGPHVWDTADLYHRVPHMMLWLFLLGWTAYFTKTKIQRMAVTSIYVLSVLTLRDLIPSEIIWLLMGGTLIIWKKHVVIPKLLILPMQMIGAASYYIYLTHVGFFSLANKVGLESPIIHLGVGVLGGIAFWSGVQMLQTWGSRGISHVQSSTL